MKLTACKNVIGVMVLIFTGTISVNGGTEFYERLPDGYAFHLRAGNTQTFKAIKTISALDCAMYCMSRPCEYFNYKPSNNSCQNFHVSSDPWIIKKSNDTTVEAFTAYETFSENNWTKVYFIKAKSGVKAAKAYLGIGTRSTWNLPQQCIQGPCSDFFRSYLIDTWGSLPIDQVKLVVYKDDKPVVTIIFNGTGTNKINWLTPERLLSDPWNDLPGNEIKMFTINGHTTRKFYLSKRHDGCGRDSGWLAIIQGGLCSYEWVSSPPMIFYSNKQTATVWHNGHEDGDSMEIFIRLVSEWPITETPVG